MKEYQDLIGKIIFAIAIVIASMVVADAMKTLGANIYSGLGELAIRMQDGLLQIGPAA